MDINTLAEQLDTDVSTLLSHITDLDRTYDLGITDVYNLTRKQYEIIRSVYDVAYLVRLLKGGKSDRKYDYRNTPDYHDLCDWIKVNNLHCTSTKEIQSKLPSHICSRGKQTIACAMRAEGYETKVMYLGDGKQGRRWVNHNTLWTDSDHPLLVKWVLDKDLSGLSIEEMQQQIPDFISTNTKQYVAAALKEAGYESRIVIIEETGKQGRRWFKAVSFM